MPDYNFFDLPPVTFYLLWLSVSVGLFGLFFAHYQHDYKYIAQESWKKDFAMAAALSALSFISIPCLLITYATSLRWRERGLFSLWMIKPDPKLWLEWNERKQKARTIYRGRVAAMIQTGAIGFENFPDLSGLFEDCCREAGVE